MAITDGSLGEEAPWIIQLCSGPEGKVLTKQEEYELIAQAQVAIKPERDPKKIGKRTGKTKGWVNRPAKLLKKYPNSFKNRPELKATLKRMATQGDLALTKLLKHNYRLIISVARKFQGRGLSWEDMIQQGSDGFAYAVAKFNLKSNNKLSTYASQWIRQRITRSIDNVGRTIRIPIHMQAQITEIKHIYRKYIQSEQDKPTSEEIADLYNLNPRKRKDFKPITKEDAEELGRYLHGIGSLDEPAGEDENLSAIDYLGDASPSPESTTEFSMDKDYLNSILCTLPSGDRIFIQFKYGLVDNSPKSDAKTAEAFRLTIKEVKEREAQIISALSKIADPGKVSMDKEVEIFSVILLAARET